MAINYYSAMDSHSVITRSSQRVSNDDTNKKKKTTTSPSMASRTTRTELPRILNSNLNSTILWMKTRHILYGYIISRQKQQFSTKDGDIWKKKNEKKKTVKRSNQIDYCINPINNKIDRESTLVSENKQAIQSNDDTTTISSLRVNNLKPIDDCSNDKIHGPGINTCQREQINTVVITL